MKKLAGLYDQLSSDERFNAFVSAASRLDTSEMDLLNDTCPRKTYTMDDWAYTGAKYRFFGCLSMMHMRVARVTGAMGAVALALMYADEEGAGKCLEIARRATTHYQALLEAWGRFCERIGIDRAVGTELFKRDTDDFAEFVINLLSDDIVGEIDAPANEVIEREVSKLMESWGYEYCWGT